MPVRPTPCPRASKTGGSGGTCYRWGKHGKVYRSKAKAEKQGRAAFANGYRGR